MRPKKEGQKLINRELVRLDKRMYTGEEMHDRLTFFFSELLKPYCQELKRGVLENFCLLLFRQVHITLFVTLSQISLSTILLPCVPMSSMLAVSLCSCPCLSTRNNAAVDGLIFSVVPLTALNFLLVWSDLHETTSGFQIRIAFASLQASNDFLSTDLWQFEQSPLLVIIIAILGPFNLPHAESDYTRNTFEITNFLPFLSKSIKRNILVSGCLPRNQIQTTQIRQELFILPETESDEP